MVLHNQECWITILDALIKCRYMAPYGEKHWQIILNDTEICYTSDFKKGPCFNISDIREFQFQMGNGATRRGDIPAASAYVILKDDPEPQELFRFMIMEEYVLLNQSKTYEFCNQILNHISERYGIPVVYKLSVETTKPQYGLVVFPILFLLAILVMRAKCNR